MLEAITGFHQVLYYRPGSTVGQLEREKEISD